MKNDDKSFSRICKKQGCRRDDTNAIVCQKSVLRLARRLKLSPYYKNQLGNTFKNGFGSEQKIRSFGLKAGISLTL